ncbi:MAG: M56 family metallopeptidase [Acidimicrobiia bacterium]|nr:M56 family metallopeptidase [Acidimicrobiia bacterium]MDH5520113.1 M56 family metallopeptidase [Acidimicrobiia bacterium]
MNVEFVLPGLAVLAVAVALGAGRWPLVPRANVWALTTVAVVAATTVTSVVATMVAGFVLGPVRRAEVVEWCRILPLHHEVTTLEGIAASVASAVMALRVVLVMRRRQAASVSTDGRRVAVLETAKPVAYAAPGKPGCVVVSTGLLSVLEPRERQVVFAHERAHLQLAHHRLLLAGALSVAVVPILAPLVQRLRLATERQADEQAVIAMGGDRQLVATAITKAAITKSSFHGLVPAISGASVVARVEALIGAPPSRWTDRTGVVLAAVGTAAVVGAGSIQMHHIWVLAEHICRGQG